MTNESMNEKYRKEKEDKHNRFKSSNKASKGKAGFKPPTI